ncbi:MAG: hypothetical protein KC766_15585, partial [Myxococcales bacterium]|nr:hypothetical protein [Myxococcales bacterium]
AAACLLTLVLVLLPRPARAWLLHEHTRITREAVAGLSPSDRASLERWWKTGRLGLGSRSCPSLAQGSALPTLAQGELCVDFAVLPALAADHSCSTADLRRSIASEWLTDVLSIAGRTEVAIAAANADDDPGDVIDAWRTQHIELRMADRKYLSRAQVNTAHFQPPREIGETLATYFARVHGAPNAIGLYAYFHQAALDAASEAHACKTDACRGRQTAMAFNLEAFALHFLEDSFSAGHVVATSGGDAERMGTHDHYCEHGLTVTTWGGEDYIAHGDAFLQDEDLRRASGAVKTSLELLLAAFATPPEPGAPSLAKRLPQVDVCTASTLSTRFQPEFARFESVLQQVPKADTPGTTSGHPHFLKELGPFYLWGGDVRINYGLLQGPKTLAYSPDRLTGRAGLGVTLDGITQAATDGIISFGASASALRRPGDPDVVPVKDPDHKRVGRWRIGVGLDWHIPYVLVPFDTLVLSPFVWLVDQLSDGDALMKMWLTASNGGLLGLQDRHRMPWTGHIQFVLGREGAITFYSGNETLISDTTVKGTPYFWQLSLPVFTWTTVHLSDPRVAMDGRLSLGYTLTRLVKAKERDPADEDEFYHGIFLSYGFESRRYF